MKMNSEEVLAHELEALSKFELIALLCDFAEQHVSMEEFAGYVDNWSKHS